MPHDDSASKHRGHPVVAALLDALMWPLRATRRDLLPHARGRVLEIGVGTGANFPYYGFVHSITALDPDPHMLRRARRRAVRMATPVEFFEQSADALPFADESFDTVVATWVLCTIPDPRGALAEMRRVLAPGGELLFAEHTISPHPPTAGLQRRLSPVWSRCAGGCQLDRNSVSWIRAAGFSSVAVAPQGRESLTLTPVYAGIARA